MKKTFAYVDGYNLYHGMMDRNYHVPGGISITPLRKYLWLNLSSFIASFLPLNYALERIYYFTAPVRDNPESLARQETYWKALESIPNLHIQKGKHLKKADGYEEKQTDVKLALQIYDDALHEEGLEAIVLLSADSDQIPTLERVINLRKNIEIFAIFPPCRWSNDLMQFIKPHSCFKTKYRRLRAHQFPDEIETKKYKVVKPIERS